VSDSQLIEMAGRLSQPDSNVPDMSLTAGVPIAPTPTPSLQDMADMAGRMTMLSGANTEAGAPIGVRAAVGAADSPSDRLATLKRYYPDAQPLPGGDNFVFTNSAGQRQTYEPMGWRIPTSGDIASVGPEIAEGIGGTVGGDLAAPGAITTPAGVGLGAAAGKSGYEGLMRFLGMTADSRTPVQQATDLATTGLLNATLPAVGEKIAGPIIGSLLRPDAPTATQAAATALEPITPGLANRLPAAVAAESPGWQRMEQTIGGFPTGGPVRNQYTDATGALSDTARGIAQSAAPGQTVPDASTFASNVGNIAQRITDRFNLQRQSADDYATQQVGATTPVDLTPLRDLRTQLQTSLATAPGSLEARYQPAIDLLNTTLADATKSGGLALPFDTVRNIRTDIGKQIDWTASGADVPTGIPAMKQVYGALKDSLTDAASNAGPQAYAALADHDAMVERFNSGPGQTFADLANPDRRGNTIAKMMQSTAPGDAQSLGQLSLYASPAERQQLQAGVIQQLGSKPDGSFDMPTWLQNYSKTTPTARNIMFGSDQTPGSLQYDLNNLATVQKTMGQSAAYRNFPNTAASLAVLSGLSSIGTHLMTGNLGAAAATGAGTFAMPYAAGRLMTSQPFTRWLAGTAGVNADTAGAWANHLARLGTVAQADPSVAGLVQQFRTQLPEQLPQSQQGGTP
jgi:hypothetical protein